MDSNNKKLPKNLRNKYKKLPHKERMKLLIMARKILDKQRKEKTL